MSLSAAFNVISSSFAANSAQTAVVSNNIANVNTPGYSREIANVVTNSYGGADVASVTREANAALTEQVSSSTSQAAAQQAISDGLSTLAANRRRQFVGLVDLRRKPERRLALGDARQSAKRARRPMRIRRAPRPPPTPRSRPPPISPRRSTAAARRSRSVREQADQNMASSVGTINSLLSQFTAANNAVVTGLQTGANVASAEDTRDSIVTQLVAADRRLDRPPPPTARCRSTPTAASRCSRIRRATVSFTPTPTLVDGQSGAPVTVDGVPITGVQFADADPVGRARRLRRVAGYARAAISGPARPDRRRPHQRLRRKRPVSDPRRCPRCPACSPRPEQPACPRCRRRPVSPPRSRSIRTSIRRRAATDVCCATAASPIPASSAYTYNSTGSASYTGRLQQLVSADRRDAELRSVRGPRLIVQPRRVRQRLGELAARREPAGEQRLVLSECARNPGDLGVVERDRRQSRRRDDQHAQPRELLRLVGEAADDRHQHVLRPAGRRMTTMSANFVSSQFLANSLVAAGHAGPVVADDGDDRGIDRPICRSRPAARRPVRLRAFAQGAGRPAPDADQRTTASFRRTCRPRRARFRRSARAPRRP